MRLVSMKEMLKKAQAGKYAVGAFNIVDENSTHNQRIYKDIWKRGQGVIKIRK